MLVATEFIPLKMINDSQQKFRRNDIYNSFKDFKTIIEILEKVKSRQTNAVVTKLVEDL